MSNPLSSLDQAMAAYDAQMAALPRIIRDSTHTSISNHRVDAKYSYVNGVTTSSNVRVDDVETVNGRVVFERHEHNGRPVVSPRVEEMADQRAPASQAPARAAPSYPAGARAKFVGYLNGRAVVRILQTSEEYVIFESDKRSGTLVAFRYHGWYTLRLVQSIAVAALAAIAAVGTGVSLALFTAASGVVIGVAVGVVALAILGIGLGLVWNYNTSDPEVQNEIRMKALRSLDVRSEHLTTTLEKMDMLIDKLRGDGYRDDCVQREGDYLRRILGNELPRGTTMQDLRARLIALKEGVLGDEAGCDAMIKLRSNVPLNIAKDLFTKL